MWIADGHMRCDKQVATTIKTIYNVMDKICTFMIIKGRNAKFVIGSWTEKFASLHNHSANERIHENSSLKTKTRDKLKRTAIRSHKHKKVAMPIGLQPFRT